MKTNRSLTLLLGSFLACGSILAADPLNEEPAPGPEPKRPEPVREVSPIAEQGRKIGRPIPARARDEIDGVTRPVAAQPEELRNLIDRFQSSREQYLERQKLLLEQLRKANEDQRVVLRERMRENLDQWRDRQLEFRTQLRERAVELRREVQSQLREVITDAVKEERDTRRRE